MCKLDADNNKVVLRECSTVHVGGCGSRGGETVAKTVSPKAPGRYLVMILPQVHLRKPCYDFTFL